MGFGEAKQQKILCQVDLTAASVAVETLPIPKFQHLARLQGDHETLLSGMAALITEHPQAWVEAVYTGAEPIGSLREDLEALCADSDVELLRIKDARSLIASLDRQGAEETLEDLSPEDVFERCLGAHAVPDPARAALRHTFQEALASLHADDSRAE
jgi:exonuclease SbcD